MNDVRRRFIRLSIFLLPALLLLAAVHLTRGDLRDAVPGFLRPGYTYYGNTFVMKKERAEQLGFWTRELIAGLERDRVYRFTKPPAGFRIEVRAEQVKSECPPGSNHIVIGGIGDEERVDAIQPHLSRVIARAMLREGAPKADYSPWFEEGVARYYEGTRVPTGSRKDELIAQAALNPPQSLGGVLTARPDAYYYFAAISHSIVAFLHEAILENRLIEYAEAERAAGRIPSGEFERIFGPDVEKAWRDFLDRRRKGS